MTAPEATEPTSIDTPEGSIEYVDRGSGPVVLFVHGSPR
jgi:hypothetical protein